MRQERPCILLYNPISGHGHLDSWNGIFAKLLLERGFGVLALTPDRHALESRIQTLQLTDRSRFHILAWNEWGWLHAMLTLRRAWRWWRQYGQIYESQSVSSLIRGSMPAGIRAKKRVLKLIVPPLYKVTRFLHEQVYSGERPSDQCYAETDYLDPFEMGLRIKAALRRAPLVPDYLFNMYLDMFKTDADSWKNFGFICRIPWGGIRFVPRDAPAEEGYYALKSFRGVCFLDDMICKKYYERVPGKVFGHLPDVTYTDLSTSYSAKRQEILRRARGRKIVFMGGSIGGQKNIARWSELISLADPTRWFFVQIGEVLQTTFNFEEQTAWLKLSSAPPENLYVYDKYLEDEAEFNSIFDAADVVFLMYRDFPISSNMLSKAAFFRKPVIASAGVLIGHEVERFGIGLAVSEKDASAMLCALEKVVQDPPSDESYEQVRRRHSKDKLADHLERFIRECLQSDHCD